MTFLEIKCLKYPYSLLSREFSRPCYQEPLKTYFILTNLLAGTEFTASFLDPQAVASLSLRTGALGRLGWVYFA